IHLTHIAALRAGARPPGAGPAEATTSRVRPPRGSESHDVHPSEPSTNRPHRRRRPAGADPGARGAVPRLRIRIADPPVDGDRRPDAIASPVEGAAASVAMEPVAADGRACR